jgi:cephalosporin-C deacetylase
VPLIDLPLAQLREYQPPRTEEPDFDAFWSRTLAQASAIPLNPSTEPVDYPIDGLRVSRAYYNGWGGSRICGWLLVPQSAMPLPALVFYHGYGGSKGTVFDHLPWVLQGFVVLAVDVRGQSGESTDPGEYPGGHVKGWMTKGITDPEHYYYRGAFMDCVRALDVLAGRPEVDMRRVGIAGTSQGGGLSIAVAALDKRPKAAMAGVPYLCHYRQALAITEQQPYEEIRQYCRVYPEREQQVYRTLSYFDGMNMAPRVSCPTLVSVGLQDLICPPTTIFAAYNYMGSADKSISVFPYNGHEGNPVHNLERLAWAKKWILDSQ